jgi:hypothetical protein
MPDLYPGVLVLFLPLIELAKNSVNIFSGIFQLRVCRYRYVVARPELSQSVGGLSDGQENGRRKSTDRPNNPETAISRPDRAMPKTKAAPNSNKDE